MDNSGPAFPVMPDVDHRDGEILRAGLTKREYAAIKIAAGTRPVYVKDGVVTDDDCRAHWAGIVVREADALLAALQEKP